MGVADKIVLLVLGLCMCSARNCVRNEPKNTRSLLWLEAKDCDGNWHEEVGGHC